jgi:parallel beta-helix repeat protein
LELDHFSTYAYVIRDALNWYVDNDAPNDLGPNDPNISDSNEDGSLLHPFDAIQEAIDNAVDGDTVVVLDGTYTGLGNRDIDFLGKSIAVRSIDPNDANVVAATIIDCNGTEIEPHRGFHFHSGEDANSILDGLTVTNGVASNWPGGGGIRCNSSHPTIRNCYLINNLALHGTGGGGMECQTSSPAISRCSFVGNEASYGGAGISIHSDSNPTITKCRFISNFASYGGGGAVFLYGSDANLVNCIIAGNYIYSVAEGGGGICCNWSGNLIISNSTITGNIAEGDGGGISCLGSSIMIRNCILWDNTAGLFGDAIYVGKGYTGLPGVIDVSHSSIENGLGGIYAALGSTVSWGNGNIDEDPLFVSPGYWDWGEWVDGDCHLLPDSLCIDAGDPNYVAEVNDFDMDGNRRVCGVSVDMGAYEYCPEKLLDLNKDGIVNFRDIAICANYWVDLTCSWPQWCEGCDLDENGIVDYNDLELLCEGWLKEYPVKFYEFSLDTDPNWTTEGEWAFGQPMGGGGIEYGNPDPTSGYTGTNVYGVNLDGDYSIAVGGPYYLTAGPFDCNDYNNVSLKFARWLNTDDPAYVESTIEVSNTGGEPWTTVWEHTRSELTDSSWRIVEYDISNVADNCETVYIRWSYKINEYAYPYSGWNIDDIELWGNPVYDH